MKYLLIRSACTLLLCFLSFADTLHAQHKFTFHHAKDEIEAGDYLPPLHTLKKEGSEKDVTTYLVPYPDGNTRERIPVRNGQLHGMRQQYYPSGSLKQSVPYRNGQIHGVKKLFYESGNIGIETDYVQNKRSGTRRIYFEYLPGPKLKWLIPYKNDAIDGVVHHFSNDGGTYFTKDRFTIRNGIIHGKLEEFDTYMKPIGNGPYLVVDSFKKSEILYAEGIVQSERKFTKKGWPLSITQYENGKKRATTYYDSSGKKIYTNIFVNDREEGLHKVYDDEGRIRSERMYRSGSREGFTRFYYSNGRIESESHFKNDRPVGRSVDYYENGLIKSEQFYRTDTYNKEWEKLYRQDGTLREATEYLAGNSPSVRRYYRSSGQLWQEIRYLDQRPVEVRYLDTSGKVLHVNGYRNGKPFGFQKTFTETDKPATASYFDEAGNGYTNEYGYNGTTRPMYFVSGFKQVKEEIFFARFRIENGKVLPR